MPRSKAETSRILPPVGTEKWPAYKVEFKDGSKPIWRFVIKLVGQDPRPVNFPTLSEARVARMKADRDMVQHEHLTFKRAIALYMASYVVPAGKGEASNVTKLGRLEMFFQTVPDLPVARLTPEKAYVIYMGKKAPELGPEGEVVYLEKGIIDLPTKKRRGNGPAPDCSGRGQGLHSGRYQGLEGGARFQVCQLCGQTGHNRRRHRQTAGQLVREQMAARAEGEFGPPSVDTHQAALREAKKFVHWLCNEGYLARTPDGRTPLDHVQPFGSKTKEGFGKPKLSDPEMALLDRTCVQILESLGKLPDKVRLPWHQRALAVLMCIRCGLRTGELRKAKRRQFSIVERKIGGVTYVAGFLQVVRESTKTGTSVRDVPITPEVMKYVLPLLDGKDFEDYFLAGAPRGRAGGIGGANWARDPQVGLAAGWLSRGLVRLCAIAGIKRPNNPHGLRGAYITGRVRRGDPFKDISRDAGHGHERVTERHYTDELALAEADQLGMMERMGYHQGQRRGAN